MSLIRRIDKISPEDIELAANNALFYGINFGRIDYMLEYSYILQLSPGARLLQTEQHNSHLYLILAGELMVHLPDNDSEQQTTLRKGDCAGEISLIDGKLPTATVSAQTICRVLAIPHHTVWSLISQSHEIARHLLETLAGRIRLDKTTLIEAQNRSQLFEHKASVDALTGIYNRHWMEKGFERALQRCCYEHKPFSIMMVDVDHFKQVNDSYGHLTGDVTLQFITKRIADCLRPYDLLVRYGGEEFLVFLFNTDNEQAINIANRLRRSVADTEIRHNQLRFNVSISIGLALTQYDKALQSLIDQADQALYQAKNNGRNRVEYFQLD